MLGSYLGMSFVTSDRRILTIANGMKRTIAARTASHTPIGGKPKIEYLGKEAETITFTIEANALYGTRPQSLIKKLRSKVGRHGNLVLGGRRISNYMLKQIDISYMETTGEGYVTRATIDLSLEEYA